jgi:hypothetical protein
MLGIQKLYNGSAVLESRNSLRTADQSLQQTKTAIAQGENIKVLTLVRRGFSLVKSY